jgi:hypothetical protein
MLPQSNGNVKDWPNGLADVEARSSRNSMALNEYLGDSASTKMSGEPLWRQQIWRKFRYKGGH